jgi:hypothetical protein
MTTKTKVERTICNECFHRLTNIAPVVGPDASPFAVVESEDHTTQLYERVPGRCDLCDRSGPASGR